MATQIQIQTQTQTVQVNGMNFPKLEEIEGRWIPVRVILNGTIVYVDTWKNGLVLAYPIKVYSRPAALRFVIDPRLIKNEPRHKFDYIELPRKFDAVVRLQRFSNVKVAEGKRFNYGLVLHRDVLEIVMLQPYKPIEKPRYKLYIVAVGGKSTAMGACARAYFNAEPIWVTENSSNSGNHWITWWVFLTSPEFRLRMRKYRRSNRGNVYEEIVDVDSGEVVPRYQELEVVRSWGWGKVVRMVDNYKMETFTALVLEYHEARKTPASTEHIIEPEDAVEPLYTTSHISKTHWTEIYKVLKPCKVKTVRVSNKGHEYVTEVDVQP